MKIDQGRTAIVIVGFLFSPFAFADKAEDLIEALNLKQKWTEKIVAPAIDKYLQRSEELTVRYFGAEQTKQITAEKRAILEGALTWDGLGSVVALEAYRQCDPAVVDLLLKSARKEAIDRQMLDDSMQSRVQECGSTMQDRLMSTVKDKFEGALSEAEQVSKRYKILLPDEQPKK